ncbi:META domain-containing protein [Olleya aquimaris]|uniref:Heat shock protein HslJ n=1 Tax=Olleya aquimaris TaxID=639310 RepID=A0A327RLX8_9FLAO|nr:META domain-containing protein [Olleya aquimaris]RAJ18040.1 heat shock protein HslJ [Olleya aquimaris]
MKTITIFLFSILLNGCGSTDQANATADMKQNINENLNGSFIVSKLGESTSTKEDLTINFDDATKRVSGFSGCNNYSGSYQIKDKKIAILNLISTEKACLDTTNMVESKMLQMLTEANSFKIKNNEVIFLNDTKELFNAKPNTISETAKQTQDNSMIIEYTAITRGTYKMVKVDQNTIKSQLSRTAQEETTACSKDNWNTLKSLAESIDLQALRTIEPPSKAHQYDGAAIANLTITVNGETYQTPAFDHGNPPKEIADLVNKLLDLAAPETKKEN